MKPAPELWDLLTKAYPCPGFSGTCQSMRWNPRNGHIPRGFLGATGKLSDVELVLVFAEPHDPKPGDHETMEEAAEHAYRSFKSGMGEFHQKARAFFNLCWPSLPFDDQLKRIWVTESVLCSAERSTGPVPKEVENECGLRYLKQQLALFPNALVVALGVKARVRLKRIGIVHFEKAHAFGLPGCNQQEALPSWVRVSQILKGRHLDSPRIACCKPIPVIEPIQPINKPTISYSPPTGMMPVETKRKTLTSEEADIYTCKLEKRVEAIGINLERWVLSVGKQNDIKQGKGPRHAIVTCAQEWAAKGATYGAVLGLSVIRGDGRKHKIEPRDLAGFVCANGYCNVDPPNP